MHSGVYSFPDRPTPAENRFRFGDKSKITNESKNHRPVFAFDFLCIEKNEFSFFHENVTIDDFRMTFKRLHELSKITIGELFDNQGSLHFHDVSTKIRGYSHLIDHLTKIFDIEIGDILKAPSLYQIEILTDNKKNRGARMIGFFNQKCEFHIIWLDRDHVLFTRDRR